MASPYASAARGIEAGFGMALRADEAAEAKRARKVQEERQAKADEQAAEVHGLRVRQLRTGMEEHDEDRAIKGVTARLAEIERQAAAAQAAGGKVDPALAQEHGELTDLMAGRARRARGVLERLSPQAQTGGEAPNPVVGAAGATDTDLGVVAQQARDFWSRAATGQADPLTTSGPELRMHLAAATGVKVDELPEVVQGTKDVVTGMQTANQGLVISGMNKAMLGRLRIGVGGESPYGGTITRKEIIGLDPAIDASGQAHPNRFIPRLRVYVQGVSPTGGEMYYDAPMTQNGSTEESDKVVAIDVKRGMDWMGNMGMLAEIVKRPDIATKLAEGDGGKSDAYIDRLRNLTRPKPKLLQTRGGDIIAAYDDGSAEVMREGPAKAAPPAKRIEQKNSDGTVTTMEWNGQEYVPVKGTEGAPRTVKARPAGGGGGGGSPALGGATPPGKPDDAVEFWARAVIAGDKDWQVGLSRSKTGSDLIEKVKRRVPMLAKEMGLDPQDIGTARAQSAALGATLKELTKRAEAIALFSSKTEKDMRTFEQIATELGRTNPTIIAKPINAVRRALSDADQARLDLAARQMATEYERLINGGALSVAQLPVAARLDAQKLVNGDMPLEQVLAITKVMRLEMDNAKAAANESRSKVTEQLRQLGRGVPTGAPGTPNAGGAAPAPAAASGLPQRPAGVPPTAKYSPSRNEWWDNGRKVWPQ